MRGQQIQNGTIEQVKLNLADPTTNVQAVTKGYGINKYISYNTITDFRLTNKSELADRVTIGDFLYKYDASDTTSVDNGTTVIRTLDGKRYKKIYFDISASDLTSINTTINGRIPFGTIADLKVASTYTSFQITNKGKEGLFYYDASDTTTVGDDAMTIVQGNKRYKRVDRIAKPEYFNAVGDGTVNDAVALQNLLNYEGLISFPYRKTYKCVGVLTYDASKRILDGNSSTIQFAAPTDNTQPSGLIIKGTESPSFSASACGVYNLKLRGDRSVQSTGIYLDDNDSGTAVAHINFQSLSISNFATGVKEGNKTYLNSFNETHIFQCDIGFWMLPQTNDSGENLRFTNCVISNCILGVKHERDGNTKFTNVSLDHNDKHISMTNGNIAFYGGHIEGRNYAQRMIEVVNGNGTGITIRDVNFATTGTSTIPDYYFWIESTTDQLRYIKVIDCHLAGLVTSSGALCGGENTEWSKFIIQGTEGYWNNAFPIVTHTSNNLVINGKFDNSDLTLDHLFINDGGTITSNLITSNVTLTRNTVGGNSLKITKIGNEGSPCHVTLAVPCKGNSYYKGSLKIKQGSVASAASVRIFYGRGNLVTSSTGIHSIKNDNNPYYIDIVPTIDNFMVIDINPFFFKTRATDTFVYVSVRLTNFNAVEVLLDDIQFYEY